MERESFEDEETAAFLNRHFIPVKVDREERPDVDHLYMQACIAMTGSGGWPLSVFLTPERKPFFAGTYFPPADRRGLPGFMTVLAHISENWRKHRKRLVHSSEKILEHIREDAGRADAPPRARGINKGRDLIPLAGRAANALMQSYDPRWGGFGGAPKFPSPHNLMFLMRYAHGEPMDSPVWSALRHTLSAMAAGGLRDHVGGGFSRYSTDRMWLVPHFEKMLYDNALLCMAYTECYEKTGEFAHIVREIITYVLREMTSPEGGFYTAQDADSEGVEGRYYCWTPDEVKAALGGREGERFCFLYDITRDGNFDGMSIPNLIRMPLGGDDLTFAGIALSKLLEERQKRVPPFRDEKVLLSSSSLMAAALAKAGRALEEPSYIRAAERCVTYLLDAFRHGDRMLALRGEPGAPPVEATLDGYAYLIWALLETHQSTLNSRYLDEARVLGGITSELFSGESGLLYYTADGAGGLPLRGVNAHDGAVPSGQSVMAHCLLRLSRLTGDAYWEEWLYGLMESLSDKLETAPEAHCWMMAALLQTENGGCDVTLTPGEGLERLRAALKGFRPFMTVRLDEDRHSPGGRAAMYICRDNACMAPIEDPSTAERTLQRQ